MILTGAGISAASGIPTFRGDNGFWKKSYKGYTDPTEILTKVFFKEHPEINWEWDYDFKEILLKAKPNPAHFAIRDLQEFSKKFPKLNVSLVTQNIDNLHT